MENTTSRYIPFNDPTWSHKLVRARDLTPGEKILYVCLVSFGGKDGECWPKQSTLAKETGISERAVRKQIKKLIDCKYIQIEHPTYAKRWERRNSKYTFINPSHRNHSSYTIGTTVPTIIGTTVPIYELRSNELRSNESLLLKRNKRQAGQRQPRLPFLEKTFDQQQGQKEVSLPSNVSALVDCYYEMMPVTRPGPRTKTMEKNVRWLQQLKAGKLYNKFNLGFNDRKFTDDEIVKMFVAHTLVTRDLDYENSDKKHYRIHIWDFLLNDRKPTKSYFLKWLETPPKRSKEKPLEDKHPEITDYLVKQLTNGKSLEESELNKIRKGAARFQKWYSLNQPNFSMGLTKDKMGEMLWRSVEDVCEYDQITAGYFCSDLTFRKRVPDYFEKQAFFRRENHKDEYGQYYVEDYKEYIKYV